MIDLPHVECRSVLLRCRTEAHLNDESFIEATKRLDDVFKSIDLLELDDAVKKRAMETFPVNVKRLDALHLASALRLLAEEPADGITVFFP